MAKFKTRLDWFHATAKRFWSYVDRGEPDDCWLWTGVKTQPTHCGLVYGVFGITEYDRSISYRAHRFAYVLANGEIPEGHQICHSCDTPLCVNPAHLWSGTNQENVADRDRKGRVQRGERHYKSVLTRKQVIEILESDEGPSELAQRLGVSTYAVQKVLSGDNWKHVRPQ